MHRMIPVHARPRRTNIMAIARRFVLMNASHANNSYYYN